MSKNKSIFFYGFKKLTKNRGGIFVSNNKVLNKHRFCKLFII